MLCYISGALCLKYGKKVEKFVCYDYNDIYVFWMLFGQVSNDDMTIPSMFLFCCRKSEAFIGEKKKKP